MLYCQKCRKLFYQKRELNQHLCSNNPIDLLFSKTPNKKVFNCKDCNKKYKTTSGFENHKCRQKKIIEENILLKQQVELLKSFSSNITNNITNVNNINNINNINNNNNLIVVQNFALPGKERVDHITKEMFLKILNQTDINDVLTDLLQLIYFNKDIPGNNRWCVMYQKEEFGALQYNVKTKKIERWVTEEVINKNFEMMVNSIQPMMDSIDESELNTLQQKNLSILYCHYGRKNISEYEPSNFKKMKMFAYNNRETPLKLWLQKGFSLPDDKIELLLKKNLES